MRTSFASYLGVLGLGFLVLTACGAKVSAEDTGILDTVRVVSNDAGPGGGYMEVRFYNDQPVAGMELTLDYDSPDVYVDSFSFVGGRLESYSAKGWVTRTGNLSVYAVAYEDMIPAGTGVAGRIYFGYDSSIPDQLVNVGTAVVTISDARYQTQFSDVASDPYAPQYVGGSLNVITSGCCLGDRGNINGSPDDAVDIADLTYMVNYMFKQGPDAECFEEIDILDNGSVDIADLIYLVNYMFKQGPPLPPCYP